MLFPSAYAQVVLGVPSCTLAIPEGEVALTGAAGLDMEALLRGRVVTEAFQGPGDLAYVVATRQTRAELDANVDLIDLGNDKTFWLMNLSTRSVREITTVPSFSNVRRSFDLGDGRVLATVQWLVDPTDPVSDVETTVYELGENGPTEFAIGIESNLVVSRLAEIVRLR